MDSLQLSFLYEMPDTVVKSSSERAFRLMLNNVDLSIFCKCYAF